MQSVEKEEKKTLEGSKKSICNAVTNVGLEREIFYPVYDNKVIFLQDGNWEKGRRRKTERNGMCR